MFWFVKTVHYYSAGPESKIGLSYVNVVCVYGGRGGGVEVLKCFVRGVRNFLLALCVCRGGGQGRGGWWSGSVYLSFREKKITDPPSY